MRLVVQYVHRRRVLRRHYALSEFDWLGDQRSTSGSSFGLDGLSVWLFGLSALLTFTAVLVSWEAIDDRPAGFYALLLLLETGMLGVFAARDIILFYIFFEFTLIPLFFLIGIWGHEERRYAAIKFFLFTFAGSVLTLLGLLASCSGFTTTRSIPPRGRRLTFSIPELHEALGVHPIPMDAAARLFATADFPGPVRRLRDQGAAVSAAHLAAAGPHASPDRRQRDLAGILLKFGTYGFCGSACRCCPTRRRMCMPWILWLAVAGIIYGALVSLVQTDMKKLIAYSSVSHLGFVILGLFALNQLSLQGGMLQMINHGLSTAGLFAVVGMIYERYHTRQISDLGGLAKRTPLLAVFMLMFTLSSIGLPGLNGFVGEFLILLGMFQRAWADAPAA